LERRPFVQYPDGFYQQIRYSQDAPLYRYQAFSVEDVQAAAKAQEMLHLRILDEIETGPQGGAQPTPNADIDDVLARNYDMEMPLMLRSRDTVVQDARMLVEIDRATGFVELGRLSVSNLTLNTLQTMALQLVYRFLGRYSADPDSAG
jgi:hypothetical protein